MTESKPKIIATLQINVLEGNVIAIVSEILDQNQVRNILHAAEEVLIQSCLEKASKPKSNIVQLSQVN
jgi:hypothetical protein